MGAVRADQAGVGSAVNDSTRLLGGTLGVAVLGSVYASLYGDKLDNSLPQSLPHALASVTHQSIGAAFGVSDQVRQSGHSALADAVRNTAVAAFDHGMTVACLVAAAVAAAGAVLAAIFLPAQPPQQLSPTPQDTREPGHERTDLLR